MTCNTSYLARSLVPHASVVISGRDVSFVLRCVTSPPDGVLYDGDIYSSNGNNITDKYMIFTTWINNGRQERVKSVNTPWVKKNCATIQSFITLTNVDRFSKFFHYCILREIYKNGWILNFTFCKVVQRHIWGVVGNVAWVLLKISRRMQQWKDCENRPTFVKVMNECIVAQFFLTHGVCIKYFEVVRTKY